METKPQHVVLVVGGAVAGSEAALQLARRGIRCIVVDQNERPYGKVEDGLPRWHVKLRLQEEKKIDEKLMQPGVYFIPRTRVGADLSLDEILGWGLSAVVFANGAWRDRPLPVSDVDKFVGRGFWYQNPYVYAFNHYLDPSYRGPLLDVRDNALVVGGGLASLDVVKILMLETVGRALDAHGHKVPIYDLEHAGIHSVLQNSGITLQDLNVSGCTLVYRRRAEDMPLAQTDEDASPERIEIARATRRKLLLNFTRKYLFKFQDQRVPTNYLVQHDQFAGLQLSMTEVRDGRVVTLPGTESEFYSPLVISSIGSIPEPIPGLPTAGEVYWISDQNTGKLEGLDRVFAIGNAVTGQGNILASRRHGRVVSQHMLEQYLLGTASGYEEVLENAATDSAAKVNRMAAQVAAQAPLSVNRIDAIMAKVKGLQERVGYPGDYAHWIERVRLPLV